MQALFEIDNDIRKEKLSLSQMKEVFSDIQRLHIARQTLFREFYYYDITNNEKYKYHNKNQYVYIRKLLKRKSLYDICNKIYYEDEFLNDEYLQYFAWRVLKHKKDIDTAIEKAVPYQVEEIKYKMNEVILDDKDYKNKDWESEYN